MVSIGFLASSAFAVEFGMPTGASSIKKLAFPYSDLSGDYTVKIELPDLRRVIFTDGGTDCPGTTPESVVAHPLVLFTVMKNDTGIVTHSFTAQIGQFDRNGQYSSEDGAKISLYLRDASKPFVMVPKTTTFIRDSQLSSGLQGILGFRGGTTSELRDLTASAVLDTWQ